MGKKLAKLSETSDPPSAPLADGKQRSLNEHEDIPQLVTKPLQKPPLENQRNFVHEEEDLLMEHWTSLKEQTHSRTSWTQSKLHNVKYEMLPFTVNCQFSRKETKSGMKESFQTGRPGEGLLSCLGSV